MYVVPPREGLPGVAEGSLLKLRTIAYGLSDAPRSWWLRLKSILEKHGWRESELERGSFKLYDQEKLVGVGGPHVDDFIVTGYERAFERSLQGLKRSLEWGKWAVDSSVHCGRSIARDPKTGDVVLDQAT